MRRGILATAVMLAAIAVAATVPAVVGGRTADMLKFERMAAVPTAYTLAKAPIRGINGGGVAWVIESAKGELSTDGSLELKFTGLVLASTNANPVGTMRAVVSCLSVDEAGAANVVNVQSGPITVTMGPASSGGGDGRLETRLSLPTPCIAPIVFITSAGGAWFAATGS